MAEVSVLRLCRYYYPHYHFPFYHYRKCAVMIRFSDESHQFFGVADYAATWFDFVLFEIYLNEYHENAAYEYEGYAHPHHFLCFYYLILSL